MAKWPWIERKFNFGTAGKKGARNGGFEEASRASWRRLGAVSACANGPCVMGARKATPHLRWPAKPAIRDRGRTVSHAEVAASNAPSAARDLI